MTEGELKQFLHDRGWCLDMIPRFKKRFAYAKRRHGSQVLTRYIKSETKFSELDNVTLEQRLQLPSAS